MKTKRKIFVMFSAIAIIATNLLLPATFSSCDSGSSGREDIYDTLWLPPIDTAQIIYDGYEKLRFQVSIDSQVIDTIEFKGSGFIRSFDASVDHNEFADVFYAHEKQVATYRSLNGEYGNIIFELKRQSDASTRYIISFNNIEYIGTISNLKGMYLSEGINYFSEITFNNSIFYKAHLLIEPTNSFQSLKENDPRLFYVKREGIVRMEIGNREIWDLIP
jgi:hypothetical protein